MGTPKSLPYASRYQHLAPDSHDPDLNLKPKLKAKADLNLCNDFGETPLIRAAYEGGATTIQHGKDCVALLIDKKSDLEVLNCIRSLHILQA